MIGWLLALACSRGPEDPRPALAAGFADARKVRLDVEGALRDGRHFEACAGLKQRVRAADAPEADWVALLTVTARDGTCLAAPDAERLAGWARGRDGWTDALGEWDAAQGRPVDPAALSAPARLRVLLRGKDQAAVVEAAGEALRALPGDPFACAVVVRDAIERGELEEALGHCPEVRTATLGRMRAEALEEAGRFEEAAAAYDAAGAAVHAGAVLVQEVPARDADGLARLDEPVPPVALHRGWRAVLRGEPVELGGLDDSPEATLLRALAGVPAAVEALPAQDTLPARVLHARLTGTPDALAADLGASPPSDVLLRADLGIRLERGLPLAPALERLRAVDGDHVRLLGVVDRREAPWRAIVPWTWADLAARTELPAAGGSDAVGEAWRDAMALDDVEARNEALTTIQADHPELRGLARFRAGGSLLDGPPTPR